MRCFVAVPLPEAVRADLARLQDELRRRGVNARWVTPERMHLTLKFLGEVPPDRFGRVKEALTPPLETHLPPPHLSVSGVGAFPHPARARVLWAGLGGDRAHLARVAIEVETRLEPLGFRRGEHPFQPHLTLGRARAPRGLRGHRADIEALAAHRGPGFSAGSVHLVESLFGARGPTHTVHLTTTVGAPSAEER